jgi:hypothetical protein
MMSVVGGPRNFFQSAATSGDWRKSLGVEVVNLIILFRKMVKKSLETTFFGFYFHFQVAKFRHNRKKNSTLECAKYVVAISMCLKKNR